MSFRQKSPNTIVANANGMYGQNVFASPRNVSPGIVGNSIVSAVNAVNVGFTPNPASGGVYAATTTPTPTTTSVLTVGSPAASPALTTTGKSPVVLVRKTPTGAPTYPAEAAGVFISPAEVTMGQLRSGKTFSPARTQQAEGTNQKRRNSRRSSQGDVENDKRRLSDSSEKHQPNAKRRDLGTPVTLFRSASETDITEHEGLPAQQKIEHVVQKSVDRSLEKFMKHMESVFTKQNEKCIAEMKAENKKCLTEIAAVTAKLGEQEKATKKLSWESLSTAEVWLKNLQKWIFL